jgi:hypothetical protein
LSRVEPLFVFAEVLAEAARTMGNHAGEAFRPRGGARKGATLRPGKDTPLWNELRQRLRSCSRRRGAQAKMARFLGLPRQRVNAFLTTGHRMPDAERTLQLIVWLIATESGRQPK